MMASSIASYLTKLLAKVFAGKIGLEPTLFWLTVSSLYHISSIPIMLLLLDLNQWPLGCKPSILTTELRSIDRVVSLTSNYPKEGPSKSSTLWKHENIVWTLWDLNSSKTLQMSCANLITLQSPFKYGYLDSNQGQLAPKASILPTELHPYIAESSVLETHTIAGTICLADSP